MRSRFALSFAALLQASIILLPGLRVQINHRVHDAGICWEPDVEFPLPCDDDDD